MRRARSFGLRPRLVLALVATSALTLAVTAAALLSPLERRLRENELETLSQASVAAQLTLAQLPSADLTAGSASLSSAVRSIGRRAEAEAVLVDAGGTLLAPADADPDDVADARRAARARKTSSGVVGDGASAEARVARPLTVHGRMLAITLIRPLDTVRSATAVVRRAMATAALLGLAVALLIGVALASELVRRLRRLRDTALLVARVGPVVEIEPSSARDEIGDLTRAFAVMQGRLREQEEARRTFVATASHELRTPLTSLQLVLHLLREELEAGEADRGSVAEQVQHAVAITGRVSALAAQLLDLSRLDAGVPPRRELIELRETSRAVIAESPSARARATGRCTCGPTTPSGPWPTRTASPRFCASCSTTPCASPPPARRSRCS
jgi:signal transduction histidine kinase